MSQPEYNDMETISRHTVDKKIKILSFNRTVALKDKQRKGAFNHSLSSF